MRFTIKNPTLRLNVNSFCGPKHVVETLLMLEKENKECLLVYNSLLNRASPRRVGGYMRNCFREGMQNSFSQRNELLKDSPCRSAILKSCPATETASACVLREGTGYIITMKIQ